MRAEEKPIRNGEVILYNTDDGAQMQLRAADGTIWLTLSEIAELYGTSSQNIGQLVKRIIAEGGGRLNYKARLCSST